MSIVYGPNIVRDGLIVHLDGGSVKKTPTVNLLSKTEELTDLSVWRTGSFNGNNLSNTHIREEGYDNYIDSKYWLISSSYIDSTSDGGNLSVQDIPNIYQNVNENEFTTTGSETVRAFSVYLKKGTHSRALIGTADRGWGHHVLVDLESGSIVDHRLNTYSGSVTQLNLTKKQNEWYLLEGSYFIDDYGFETEYNTNRNNGILIALANPTEDSPANARDPDRNDHIFSGSEFIYIAKPQLEDRHFCTPYVNGERKYDEDYDWYDLSGNGNNATFNNDKNELEIGFVPSRKVGVGGYFDFDKVEKNEQNFYTSGSSLDFGDFFGGQPIYDYTISTWVTEEFGFATGEKSAERLFFIVRQVPSFTILFSNPGVFEDIDNDNHSLTSSDITLPDTKWKNYCLVNKDLERKLYINGTLIFTYDNEFINSNPPSANTTLMRGGSAGAQRYSGSLASFSFYDRALTENEVQQNFNALKGRFGL